MSLLDDENILAKDSWSIVESFIRNNYFDDEYSYRMDGDIYVVIPKSDEVITYDNIEELTNGLFRWDNVSIFNCSHTKIKSLEGAPQECNEFSCYGCNKLESLEGAPKKCVEFYCNNCNNLTTLKGAPEECEAFDCKGCANLKSLKGAPKDCEVFEHDFK